MIVGLSGPGTATAAAWLGPRKPNVVVIVADDLGYADVGFHGCRDIPTPHLDSLARSGVRFTDGYASSPVCSPTRAGLLTGRYPQRFGFGDGGFLAPGQELPPSEASLAELLGAAGYVTGLVGKWHLGKAPEFHPSRHGFDAFFGILGGARYYIPMTEPDSSPFARAFREPILRGHEPVDPPPYLTDALGDEAVSFIRRHQARPFFLYLAFNAVHVPLQATDAYLRRIAGITDTARRTYGAMLVALDDAVGRVIETLHAGGLERDTLIIFLSDNGGHPIANAARNAPLRGEKSTLYEGGIRVPFLMSWPGRIPAGGTIAEPVISLDILPTALGAADVAPPPERPLDGVNLLPYLAGAIPSPPRATLFWRYDGHRAVRHGRWKWIAPAGERAGLYDLSADDAESNDLSAAHPEMAEKLADLHTDWTSELPPPRRRDLPPRQAR